MRFTIIVAAFVLTITATAAPDAPVIHWGLELPRGTALRVEVEFPDEGRNKAGQIGLNEGTVRESVEQVLQKNGIRSENPKEPNGSRFALVVSVTVDSKVEQYRTSVSLRRPVHYTVDGKEYGTSAITYRSQGMGVVGGGTVKADSVLSQVASTVDSIAKIIAESWQQSRPPGTP